MKSQTSKSRALAKVEKILNEAPPNKTLIIQFPVNHIWECNSSVIKILQRHGYSGIYVTLTKSYYEIIHEFQNMEIDVDSLIFIDGISRLYGYQEIKSDNVSYIRGPVALKDLASKIKSGMARVKSKKKFIFIGSLSSLMLYNSPERLSKFLFDLNEIINSDHALILASQYCNSDIAETVENAFENETISIDLRDCNE